MYACELANPAGATSDLGASQAKGGEERSSNDDTASNASSRSSSKITVYDGADDCYNDGMIIGLC